MVSSKKKAVINEILETERVYFNSNLTELKTLFHEPLQKKIADEKDPLGVFSTTLQLSTPTSPLVIVEARDIVNTIFSKNLIPLHSLHQGLLQDLEDRVKNEKNPALGPVFLRIIPFMKLYTEYVNNYEIAVAALNELEKNKKFSAFIESIRSPSGNIYGFGYLFNLLITPVQRIPRYELLFKELLRNSEEADADYKELQQTVESLKGIASDVNEKKRAHENLSKLHQLNTQLTGRGKKPNLLQPNTRLIRIGELKSTLYVESESKTTDAVLTVYLLNRGILLVKPEPKKKQMKVILWAKYKNLIVKSTETKIVCYTAPVMTASSSSSATAAQSASLMGTNGSASSPSSANVGGTQLILHFEKSKEDCKVWSQDISDLKAAIRVEDAPLHDACKEGKFEVVLKLLGDIDLENPKPTDDQIVQANKRDSKGRTPLMLAAKYDQQPLVHLLVEGFQAEVNIQDNRGRAVIDYAESTGNKKLIATIDNYLKGVGTGGGGAAAGASHSAPALPNSAEERRRNSKRGSTFRSWKIQKDKSQAAVEADNEPTSLEEVNSELEIVVAKIGEYELKLKQLNERKIFLENQKAVFLGQAESNLAGPPSTPPPPIPTPISTSSSSVPIASEGLVSERKSSSPIPLSSSAPAPAGGTLSKGKSTLVTSRANVYENSTVTPPTQNDQPETKRVSLTTSPLASGGPGSAGPRESTSSATKPNSGASISRTSTKLVEIPQVATFHTYDELTTLHPPNNVDIFQKEAYLSPEEFETVMGMSKEQFYALPKWRRDKKKQEVGLF